MNKKFEENEPQRRPSAWARIGWGLVLSSMIATPALSAQTDISSSPITATSGAQIKPNIMMLMDTSFSMGWTHMPDEVEQQVGIGSIGYKSSQCNALYYNPTQTYGLPKDANGVPYPLPSFGAARYDAFDVGNTITVDLSKFFQAYDSYTLRYAGSNDHGPNTTTPTPGTAGTAAYYYVKSGGTVPITSYASTPCADADPWNSTSPTVTTTTPSSDGGTWTRVLVQPAEQQNFATWYAYHRTRMLLMKTAASIAFTPLTDSFRVGFITVKPKDNPTDPSINPAKYLPINDFNTVQRGLWYDKLFAQKPSGSSPTREGLARVGRHYANMHDGINTGMPEDPVQYSCQQNFTIMTTDGYWNTADESQGLTGGYIGGPVDITGKALVAGPTRNPDGVKNALSTNTLLPPLTPPATNYNVTPRPIWDGSFDGQRTVYDRNVHNEYIPCGTYFNRVDTTRLRSTSQLTQTSTQSREHTEQQLQSTAQTLATTTQTLQDTSQPVANTFQRLQSTQQDLRNSYQKLVATSQTTQTNSQISRSTLQYRASTYQNLENTQQASQTQTRVEESVWIPLQSTQQTLQSTSQLQQSTSQLNTQTVQHVQSTQQNVYNTQTQIADTSQTTTRTDQTLTRTHEVRQRTQYVLQRTDQTTQTTSQIAQSTSRVDRSTIQLISTPTQTFQSTSQTFSCNAAGENCVPGPVGSCVQSSTVTCEVVTTGPTLVDSCTNDPAAAGNNYKATTCSSSTGASTPVPSCTNQAANGGNGHTAIVCSSNLTGPAAVPSCVYQAASVGNAYTETNCTPVNTGPTFVQTCTPVAPGSGNNWTTTSCTPVVVGPVGVASCSPQTASAGNGWTTISCNPNNTPDTPVSACTPAAAGSGNGWTTTTCTPVDVTANVTTCSNASPTAGNGWKTVTCTVVDSAYTPVQTCTPVAASTGNGFVETQCSVATTSVGTASCAPIAASAANNWTATSCPTVVGSTTVLWGSCTNASANAGNAWTATTCSVTTSAWMPRAGACFADYVSGGGYVFNHCQANNTGPTPVASCTAALPSAGNGYTTTSCTDNISALTPTAACTPVAAAPGNSYTATTCPVVTTSNVPVGSCTPDPMPNAGNTYTTTSCNTATTSNTPVQTCGTQTGNAGNAWLNVTCTPNNTTNQPVAACSPQTATGANNWTTVTCPPEQYVSGPTVVASCTPVAASAGNGYQRHDCNSITTTTAVQAGTCVNDPPSAANGYVGTTCSTLVASNPVLSCTPQTASAANNWVEIVCGTNNNINFPVVSCAPQAASAGNAWTQTVCLAPVTTGPTYVASCTYDAPNAGNAYTETTCSGSSTTTGVASCTPQSPNAGNSFETISCGTNITPPTPTSPSCVDIPPAAGNGYTTTTCSDNNQLGVPVGTCSPQTASSGNSWTAYTCPPPIVTTNVPVPGCTPDTANAGNAWTTTTCADNNVPNTATASCVPQSASAGNNWTLTTCTTLLTGPVGVDTCTPQTGNAGNSWLTVNCASNNSTNVPVDSSTCLNQTRGPGNGWLNRVCTTTTTTNVPVASCSASAATTLNNWITTSCSSVVNDVASGSCTPQAASVGNNWTTTTCPSVIVNTGVTGCTPQTGNAGNNWTTITCPGITNTGPTAVASCTPELPSSANGYTTVTCNTSTTPATLVTSCVAQPPIAGNGYVETACTQVYGSMLRTTTTSSTQQFSLSGTVATPLGPPLTVAGPPVDSGVCNAPGSVPPLPADGPATWTSADASTYPSCTGWPCQVDVNNNSPKSLNSLADVAQYYYVTDLRTAANEPRGPAFYRDNVFNVGTGAEDDHAPWQHMTTIGVALGVSGTLNYRSDYKTATTGDFADIRCPTDPVGCKNWPLWPDPALNYASNGNLYNDPRSIDDFWHASVNGRGTFFSASDPSTVADGLASALAGITARTASSAGAGASNLTPVTGDNFAYLASFTTQKWIGNVEAHEIDVATGAILTPVLWSADGLLNGKVGAACDDRKILLYRETATDKLVNFTSGTVSCSGGPPDTGLNPAEMANFGATSVALLSQYPSMTNGSGSTPDQRSLAADSNLVNFLRGQTGLEDFTSGSATRLYRKRDSRLGDIVNGAPTFVSKPFANYGDAGYATFKAAQVNRTPLLFVPANDGMLHAFHAATKTSDPYYLQRGQEAWAFIPTAVLPKLFKLADANYKNIHEYYVDGTPSVSDVYDGTNWKTMLVGGLNSGGRGYYALDITDPVAPKAMWEFNWSNTCYDPAAPSTHKSDCHLGLSFGKPIISKLADGRWVVMVTSGYNNVRASGANADDGKGFLYVLEATTGRILYKISTGVGDTTTPSGLAQINNFVENADLDNTTVRVYGTDLLGNIWRFDVNDTMAPTGREAVLVGQALDADTGGQPQPITTRAEVTKIGNQAMIFVATGRFLGASDITDTQRQSVYGIVDPLSATTAFTDLRGALAPLNMTTVTSPSVYRTVACTTGSPLCSTNSGWRVDLPDTGERVNVEMKLRDRTLIFGSNVPDNDPCKPGGYSWLNYLDYKSGLAVNGSPNNEVTVQLADALIVGLTVIKVADGTIRAVAQTTAGPVVKQPPVSPPGSTLKRISWREIPAN